MTDDFMEIAIEEARKGINQGDGGPFGACIVKDNQIISRSHNSVPKDNDPTAHAEMNAIREASKKLGTYDLSGCTIYATCEPCPMCLSAIYWSKISKLVYGCSRYDAAKWGFDDDFIYAEIQKDQNKKLLKIESGKYIDACTSVANQWLENPLRKKY